LRIPSLVQAVGGEERRSPLSIKRCLECHDTLVYHDGTHVLGYTYDQYTTRATARVDNICLICHNPNLSSSGRGATLTGAANKAEVVALLGGNPLLYPEASLNLKDMLHGVHGTANPTRTVPLEFVSDRGTNGLFYSSFINRSQKLDFPSGQIVGYPGNLTNCTKCHAEGFGVLDTPDMALLSTWKTTDGVDATPAAVVAARAGMPNATDLVVAPVATACYACHNNDPLRSHIRLMGGGGFQQRNQVTGAQ
jgi:OmcA/MtrC family decaheme c-type cytochrome